MKILQGIDISSVSRIQKTIEKQGKTFLDRVFTSTEQAYCEARKRKFEHYAARFAGKEAVLKAVEVSASRRCDLVEIEILNLKTGKPVVSLSEKVRKDLGLAPEVQIEISLSHEREFAIATVLITDMIS